MLYEGVSLRDFTVDDIEKKVKWINNPSNNKFLHYDIPITIDGTTKWFFNKDNKKRKDFVIEYENTPVGIIGLLNIDKINLKAEYYITIGCDRFKRKGIASKATNLILKYAFEDMNLLKVYLNVDEKNEVACHLYEKVGFKCEGIFIEDMIFKGEFINRRRYAIRASEFER